MVHVFPNYYKDFQCIGGSCKHNCCIGWEIDIDPDTLAFYDTVPGEFGTRLKACISHDGVPHFTLDAKERCPFLNQRNLCDIILTLGEEHICGICTDHPRFRNELPGRIETGLGLCCEEAARLILSQQSPMFLEYSSNNVTEDEIILLRDQVITLLQDRSISVQERVDNMLQLCNGGLPAKPINDWAELLLSLERLDDAWTQLLIKLRDYCSQADITSFDHYMSSRQTEYEQFVVYLVYRHLANSSNFLDLTARANFAALGYQLIHQLGSILWSEHGTFSFQDQIELVRLFSSEIEYSDENLYILFDELC